MIWNNQAKDWWFFQGADLQMKFIARCLIFNLMFKVLTALSGGSHARPRRELPLLLQSTASSQRPTVMLAFTATKASPSSLCVGGHMPWDIRQLEGTSTSTYQPLPMAQNRLKLFPDKFSPKVESSSTVNKQPSGYLLWEVQECYKLIFFFSRYLDRYRNAVS